MNHSCEQSIITCRVCANFNARCWRNRAALKSDTFRLAWLAVMRVDATCAGDWDQSQLCHQSARIGASRSILVSHMRMSKSRCEQSSGYQGRHTRMSQEDSKCSRFTSDNNNNNNNRTRLPCCHQSTMRVDVKISGVSELCIESFCVASSCLWKLEDASGISGNTHWYNGQNNASWPV